MNKYKVIKEYKDKYYNGKYGKLHRRLDSINKKCPVCNKSMEPVNRADLHGLHGSEIVKLTSNWMFINTAWGIEFVLHPKCKFEINGDTIFPILKKLGIPYQDQLLAIALEDDHNRNKK